MEKSVKKVEKKKSTKKVVKKSAAPKKTKKTVSTKASSKPKKVVSKKTSVKKEVKPVVEEKQEPWYIWLKNNIIENEEKYSQEDKYRRLAVSLFMVLCFFTVLFSAAIADYNYAYKSGKTPVISIRVRDEYNQATIYYGMFYKAWKCDNGITSVNFSRFKTKITGCSLVANYDESGVYTNPYGVKITKSQMNVIKNYYYDYYVYFKNSSELENAYKISKEINKVWWVRKQPDKPINGDESIGLAIFGKVDVVDGVEEWNIQYDSPEYYKCVKNIDGSNVFATYNHLDNTCENDWKNISLSGGTCSLAANSSEFVKNLVKLSGLCE